MNPILAALGTIIQPAIVYAEQKLISIGAAFVSGFAVILNGFGNDQRAIGANVIAFWQGHYHQQITAGVSVTTAIENASTAALNEFCSEEGKEFQKEAGAIITLLESSVRNGLALSA